MDSSSMIAQMNHRWIKTDRAIEQYFLLVLFVRLHKAVLTFESVHGWNPMVCHHYSVLVKAIYFLRFTKMLLTFLVTFLFDHIRSNSFNLGNQSNNEWHFELIGWNGSRMIIRNNNCFSMTHFLSPFREPSQLKQDLNSCPKAQGW